MSDRMEPILERVAKALHPEPLSIERVRLAAMGGKAPRAGHRTTVAVALAVALTISVLAFEAIRSPGLPAAASSIVLDHGDVVGVRSRRGLWVASRSSNEVQSPRRLIAVAPEGEDR